jgi:hypothetical protein
MAVALRSSHEHTNKSSCNINRMTSRLCVLGYKSGIYACLSTIDHTHAQARIKHNQAPRSPFPLSLELELLLFRTACPPGGEIPESPPRSCPLPPRAPVPDMAEKGRCIDLADFAGVHRQGSASPSPPPPPPPIPVPPPPPAPPLPRPTPRCHCRGLACF